MPRLDSSKPVVFANATISVMVFEPSVNEQSIFGFIFLAIARSRTVSGLLKGSKGLFLPFPAQTISKFKSRAKSTKTLASTGSSPWHTA